MSDVQSAIQKLQSGHWIDAIDILSELPDSFPVCNYLGIAHQMNRNWKGARLAWEKALQFDSNAEDVLLNLGIACIATEDKVSAEKYWLNIVEQNPAHVQSLINLGLLYREQEQNQKAHDYWEKALSCVPNQPKIVEWIADVKGVLGYRYLQQGNILEAERLLRTAIAMDASHAMLWAYLSEVLLEKSDYTDALTAAKKATELEPQNATYYHLIAVVYQRIGDEKSAMAMRSKAEVFENQEK